MRHDVPALFHERGIVFISGTEMTLPCESQMVFGVAAPLTVPIRGEIGVRQSVAGGSARRGANGMRAPSVVVAGWIGSLGDLVTPDPGRSAIASLEPLMCGSPAKLRSRGSPKSGATAGWVRAHPRLRCPVHTPLKVSRCAVLTQSRNSGNNLQLSEKSFRRSEIAIARIQAMPGNGARRRTITRPFHFKLTPLG